MIYNSFIIRCLGVLAPFLCLVRTFRVGFHSVQLSKGSKWASSDPGSARHFISFAYESSVYSPLATLATALRQPLSLSLSYKIFSSEKKNNKKRERR